VSKAVAAALAFAAYAVLAAGMILMKKGIAWIGHKGPKDGAWRRDLWTWIAGFLLSNLYVVPSLMALSALTPHIVGAFAGSGVVVLVLLASAVLGEKLHRSDILYTAVVVLSIILLNVYEPSSGKGVLNIPLLAAASAFPLLLFTPIVVLIKTVVETHGFRIAEYLRSPYVYLYLFFSLTAFIALQLAFRIGSMMRTGPVQYGSSIVYPAVCSALVFGNVIRPVQVAALAAIVLAVAGLLRKH
jgi:multidrug transporter EmrE-like cation transporter